jgi:carbon-monoxide dehydrogenase large subunit
MADGMVAGKEWTGRLEDPALLRGEGRYADDVRPANVATAVFVRAPVAYANITALDVSAARAAPGVIAVLTSADMADTASVSGPMPQTDRHGKPISRVHRPVLAHGQVRHVGEPVVLVVAESAAAAQDAAELVTVEYDSLTPVTTVLAAVAPGAPQIWPDVPGNVALDWVGPADADGARAAAIEAAFARAAFIGRMETPNQRLVVATMEPRAATAFYDPQGGYTLRCGTQGAAGIAHQVMMTMKLGPDQLRVLSSEDVGGGFGMKASSYPEYPALLHAARIVGRPVHWVSSRSEAFVSDNQGRDNHWTAEMAMDQDGRFLAARIEGVAGLGAYITGVGAFANTINLIACLPGMYDIPLVSVHVRCVLTNTVPIGPYRGAGRPEINFLLERLVEGCATASGIDPVELRRRNLIQPAAIPYTTAVDTVYDSGDFPTIFETAVARADYAGFPARRAASAAQGKLRGFGVGCFLENSGGVPEEPARITFPGDGLIHVSINSVSQGQGHVTVFGDVAARYLGVPREQVKLTCGDSRNDVPGMGAVASRSAMMVGGAIVQTAQAVLAKARQAAGLLLQADPAALVYENGSFRVGSGTGAGAGLSLIEVAARAHDLAGQGVIGEKLDTMTKLVAKLAFPNGCHIAEVEIEPETGSVTVARYTAVDDCGNVLNPTIVAAQIQGAVAQGLGQALSEDTVYDPESGQLVAGSFMDYAMPRADNVPTVDGIHVEVPCTTNPLGVKGTGEAGTTAAPSAIINAILNALPPGTEISMPATSEKIWRALRA